MGKDRGAELSGVSGLHSVCGAVVETHSKGYMFVVKIAFNSFCFVRLMFYISFRFEIVLLLV